MGSEMVGSESNPSLNPKYLYDHHQHNHGTIEYIEHMLYHSFELMLGTVGQRIRFVKVCSHPNHHNMTYSTIIKIRMFGEA